MLEVCGIHCSNGYGFNKLESLMAKAKSFLLSIVILTIVFFAGFPKKDLEFANENTGTHGVVDLVCRGDDLFCAVCSDTTDISGDNASAPCCRILAEIVDSCVNDVARVACVAYPVVSCNKPDTEDFVIPTTKSKRRSV